MNGKREKNQESYRSFLLMSEIEQEGGLSQRELASRLGIAVGLVNSYLKNLVAKGFVRVKNYPRNRYAYLLTPKGIGEKSRLALQHLNYFNSLYGTVRQDYRRMFDALRQDGASAVVFCGVDEVAEIAYLSLREVGLELDLVVDETSGGHFFGHPVHPIADAAGHPGPVVLTSLKRREQLFEELQGVGLSTETVLGTGQG